MDVGRQGSRAGPARVVRWSWYRSGGQLRGRRLDDRDVLGSGHDFWW